MTSSSTETQKMSDHWLMKAKKRLLHEFKEFIKSPLNDIAIKCKDENMLEWHFLFKGLKKTPFEGGEYHGVLTFPDNYPFSPPSIRFITPNGRFEVNERVCFALSDFHPECWKPAYTVSAVLQGVYSFMMSETMDTVGSLIRDYNNIRLLARISKDFNKTDKLCAELFNQTLEKRGNSSKDIEVTHSDGQNAPSNFQEGNVDDTMIIRNNRHMGENESNNSSSNFHPTLIPENDPNGRNDILLRLNPNFKSDVKNRSSKSNTKQNAVSDSMYADTQKMPQRINQEHTTTSSTVGSMNRDENLIKELAKKSKKFNKNDCFCIEISDDFTEPSDHTEACTNPPVQKKSKNSENQFPKNTYSDSTQTTKVKSVVSRKNTGKNSDSINASLSDQQPHGSNFDVVEKEKVCSRLSVDINKSAIIQMKPQNKPVNKNKLDKYKTTSNYKSKNADSVKVPVIPPLLDQKAKLDAKSAELLKASKMKEPNLKNPYL